ncbi:MAG TPA: undecaprenyl-diphosphatase UppP [Pyrinomonadaceae bacterium]|nr:undecaprenyl-diphosphatase UppP [Pyrinomonadaceae bacterium]
MSIIQAIILGIVQGLTEFIPISSTAHLIFAGRAVGLYDGVSAALRAERTTATIAVLQLGTLLAVLVYFAGDIWRISRAFILDHLSLLTGKPGAGPAGERLSLDARLGWLIVIGSIPIAVIGLLFKKQIEGTFTKNLWIIATMMIVIGVALAIAEMVGKQQRSMEQLGIFDAIVVGFAQCLALIPGSSRSGSTIMAGLFAGEVRETAARFSFLLSIPAVGASGLLELKEAVHKLPPGSGLPVLVGTIVSFLVGYASIWFLLRFLRTHSTGVFIAYRMIIGCLILIGLWGGYISASVK